MRPMTAGEMDRMEATQEDALFFTCLIGEAVDATSNSGGLSTAYVDGSPQPCALILPKTRGAIQPDKTVVQYEAYLRLRRDLVVHVGDRITIVALLYGDMAHEVYYVQAPGEVYPSTILYPLGRTVPA